MPAGDLKIPDPIVDPTRIATAVQSPILRGSPSGDAPPPEIDSSASVFARMSGCDMRDRYCKGPTRASRFSRDAFDRHAHRVRSDCAKNVSQSTSELVFW